MAAMWVPDKRHSLMSARQPWPGRTGGMGAAVSPNVPRFLSIFQTKANWQVRLINFGGRGKSEQRGPGAGRGGRGASRREGRWPREMPVPSVAPGLALVGTFPRGCGLGSVPTGLWSQAPGVSPDRRGKPICAADGAGRLADRRGQEGGGLLPASQGQARAAPGAQSQEPECVLLVHARCQHFSDKEPVPMTSAFYNLKMCHREPKPGSGVPAGGEEGRLWSKQGRKRVPLAHLQSRAQAQPLSAPGLGLGAGSQVRPLSRQQP